MFPGIIMSESHFESVPHRVSSEVVAGLQPGAVVHILYDSPQIKTSLIGTVLHTSPQGVALMNCKRVVRSNYEASIASRLPYYRRIFKESGIGQEHVPVLWASIQKMTAVVVIEPPPADYVAPQFDLDTNDKIVFERIEIEFGTETQQRSCQRCQDSFDATTTFE